MSTPQSSTPYSLRVPTRLVLLIEQVARKIGKPAPDAVRAGIEAAFGNEFRMLALDAANADRAGTLRALRGAITDSSRKTKLAMPIYSGLMYFLHWAYLHAGVDGCANPRYVIAMLDIIRDLMMLCKDVRCPDGHYHATRSLGIQNDEGIDVGIERIKREIKNGLSIGYAEMLTRPLEGMADDLQYLDSVAVAKIFAPHLKTLLPVAVRGARLGVDMDIVLRDMEDTFPEAEKFQINDMNWALHGKSMALIVSEGHHTYAFGSQPLLSIYMAIECGALADVLAINDQAHFFSRDRFELSRMGDHVVMHTNGGYRLGLSVLELRDLVNSLTAAFKKPAWQALVTRCREMNGDL